MMPPKVAPTDEILSDVTQRLHALNQSQTSLASMTSSRSMPVVQPLRCGRAKHSCDLCLKQCSSSTQLQFHRQTHVMENMAVRLKSSKAVNSAESPKAKEEHPSQQNLEVLSLEPPSMGKLESFLHSGRQKIRRGKAHIAPKAHVSTFFAGRKTSQRSASSGDSGYESMERPDPVAALLGMKAKEARLRCPDDNTLMGQPAATAKVNLVKRHKDEGTEYFHHSAYFNRRRSDEINKFKKFSKQLDEMTHLTTSNVIPEDSIAVIRGVRTEISHSTKITSSVGQPQLNTLKPSVVTNAGIASMGSAMSSTDDILGELVSPTSYRSRMESCRQSGASMSEGELSFMGIRAPSLYSVNLRDTESDSLAERLAHNVTKRCFDLQHQGTIRSRTTSRQDSNQSTPPTSARHTPATSVSSNPKRSRDKDEGSEDPDDDDVRRRDLDTKRSRLEVQQDLKLFACPYSKFDPQRFSELNVVEKEYRRCSFCYLRDIPRLKQHLYRVHRRPEYYCGSCFDSFKSRESLDIHVRQRPSCELRSSKFEEKMTDDQLNSIKRRIVKGDPCELWFNIFKTLFPNAPRPLSPYASDNDPTLVTHFVNLFRWFGPEELFNLMRDRREQIEGINALEATTQAIVDEAFEIALPVYLQTQQEGRIAVIVDPDLSRVQSTASGYTDIGSGTQTAARQQGLSSGGGRPPSTMAPAAFHAHEAVISDPFAPNGSFRSSQMLSTERNAAYGGETWPDTMFDPTEVMLAFESYGSVANAPLPIRNTAEVAVEEFFDFSSFRA